LGDSSQIVEQGGFFSIKPYFSRDKVKKLDIDNNDSNIMGVEEI
jgi:hypothetical protein